MSNYLFTIFGLIISATLLSACSNISEEELPEKIKVLDNVTILERNADPESTINFTEIAVLESSEKAFFSRLTALDVGSFQ